MPLGSEERLFIEAIRGLNYQASRLRAEENSSLFPPNEDGDLTSSTSTVPRSLTDDPSTLTVASALFPNGSTIATTTTSTSNHDTLSNNGTPEEEANHPSSIISITNSSIISAADGLNAAADALADIARKTYLNSSAPNLNSAISWIHNLSRSNTGSTPNSDHVNKSFSSRLRSESVVSSNDDEDGQDGSISSKRSASLPLDDGTSKRPRFSSV